MHTSSHVTACDGQHRSSYSYIDRCIPSITKHSNSLRFSARRGSERYQARCRLGGGEASRRLTHCIRYATTSSLVSHYGVYQPPPLANMASSSAPDDSSRKMSSGDVEAIGAHCQAEYCRQLDFLPFKCQSCKGCVSAAICHQNISN